MKLIDLKYLTQNSSEFTHPKHMPKLVYRAPEMMLGLYNYFLFIKDKKWSFSVDMWSLGCVIHYIAIGKKLFKVKFWLFIHNIDK